MKKLSLLALSVLTAGAVQAAPVVTPKDLTPDALKGIATDKQRASLEAHETAVAKAEKERADKIKEARDITEDNDRGMKKTIQKHELNTMLPACEREPETPREPGDYTIRF